MSAAKHTPGHKLLLDGPLGGGRWRCECGHWEAQTPAKGPYGRTSMRARMAQLTMAHDKHRYAAIAKAAGSAA